MMNNKIKQDLCTTKMATEMANKNSVRYVAVFPINYLGCGGPHAIFHSK